MHVLGPPTLEQQNIKKYAKNSDEYWLASTGGCKAASEVRSRSVNGSVSNIGQHKHAVSCD